MYHVVCKKCIWVARLAQRELRCSLGWWRGSFRCSRRQTTLTTALDHMFSISSVANTNVRLGTYASLTNSDEQSCMLDQVHPNLHELSLCCLRRRPPIQPLTFADVWVYDGNECRRRVWGHTTLEEEYAVVTQHQKKLQTYLTWVQDLVQKKWRPTSNGLWKRWLSSALNCKFTLQVRNYQPTSFKQ